MQYGKYTWMSNKINHWGEVTDRGVRIPVMAGGMGDHGSHQGSLEYSYLACTLYQIFNPIDIRSIRLDIKKAGPLLTLPDTLKLFYFNESSNSVVYHFLMKYSPSTSTDSIPFPIIVPW